jgi:enterochelin esterase-like enzyme
MVTICARLIALALVLMGTPAISSELKRELLPSAALGRDMPFVVYTPDNYNEDTRQYPVLYLLHGAGGDENAWAERGHIKEKADKLIANGSIPPVLIVMPGCPRCWWVDGAQDKAETAFWDELVPTISRRYRTIETRDGRFVAGLSAGGYGAIRYALKYPDRVGASAAFSPAIYSDTPPAQSSARSQPAFQNAEGAFDQKAWNAKNYPSLLDGYFKQPARVPMYLVSGDNDSFGIVFETVTFFKRMYDKQPALSELRVVDGDHNWTVWASAIDDAMKFMFHYAAPSQIPKRPASTTVIAAKPR